MPTIHFPMYRSLSFISLREMVKWAGVVRCCAGVVPCCAGVVSTETPRGAGAWSVPRLYFEFGTRNVLSWSTMVHPRQIATVPAPGSSAKQIYHSSITISATATNEEALSPSTSFKQLLPDLSGETSSIICVCMDVNSWKLSWMTEGECISRSPMTDSKAGINNGCISRKRNFVGLKKTHRRCLNRI